MKNVRAAMPSSLRGFLVLVAGSGLLSGVLGCAGQSEGEVAQAEPAARSDVPVAVHVVSSGRAEAAVRAWGTVVARRDAEILAGVSGRVEAAHVGLGDRVRRGQPLLDVDAALYRAALDEAEALFRSAEAAFAKANSDLERHEALFAGNIISSTEIEQFRNAALTAEAAHAQAAANRERARKNFDDARITAPFDGTVAVRPPDPGSSVGLGMPLTRVVDLSRVRVRVDVPEADLARLTQGMAAIVLVDALPGRRFEGTVAAIGPQADAMSRQYPVEVDAVNPEGQPLKAGMVARVEIVYEAFENVALVPVDALVEDRGRRGVFVTQGGVARWRDTELGPRSGNEIAVRSGVAPGDSVVVLGQTRLADGSRVKVEEAP